MKAQQVTVSQLPVAPAANESTTPSGVSPRERPGPNAATHTAPHTFGITAHGDTITARAFDLLYGHTNVAIIDVPGAGAFLTADTALALADLIAADPQLATLIRQRDTLGGAA